MILTKETMTDISNAIATRVPGMGFGLLVFPMNRPADMNYSSNADREDMVVALRTAANQLEAQNAALAAQSTQIKPPH